MFIRRARTAMTVTTFVGHFTHLISPSATRNERMPLERNSVLFIYTVVLISLTISNFRYTWTWLSFENYNK